ncbi:MAG TPA: PQQ-binding-like beta-propeller repeat protein [Candidatus Acidoferrales bacterium]|nr:PQQ-binding-like beta-propeller repeat protein [Candidatus Acidoferrales bacterium]
MSRPSNNQRPSPGKADRENRITCVAHAGWLFAFRAVFFLLLLNSAGAAFAAQRDAATIYQSQCASCHDNSAVTRAPAPAILRAMLPENIVLALETGSMKLQGASLTADEKRAVAEFLADKKTGERAPQPTVAACADTKAPFSPSDKDWNGWGADLANTRFQPAGRAGLNAAQVPKLKLKWAFAFPNTLVANGQPTVVGGRIFVPSANRTVYSLDARSGCQYWTFVPDAPSRTAITVAALPGEPQRYAAFFGDGRGNAYAVDASTGELLWKVHLDSHPQSRIAGAPVFYEGRVYVPMTASEEAPAMNPAYACCSARGGIAALDATTGKQIWKSYTIAEEPHLQGKNSAGTQLWGPSGASIWSAPTIDTKRRIIYAGTGDNFSDPATDTSDAVLAFDLDSGKVVWSKQLTGADVFNMACEQGPSKANCPQVVGPDFDIGGSPILATLAKGKRVLLVGQKSGVAHGLDPDHGGKILWQTRVGHGGALGGIEWGSATDGKNMYVALSDIGFQRKEFTTGRKLLVDPKSGGGLFAIDILTGKKLWAAPPPSCGDRPNCSPAQSAAVSAIPGVVFSGSVDGHLRAYSASDGTVVWDFDTAREFKTVNGLTASGGSIDGPGPTISGGMVFAASGYGGWGGLPGNVLLAFSVDGD